MARGDRAVEHAELPPGWVLTTSGRISGSRPGLSVPAVPHLESRRLDDALTYSSRACQVSSPSTSGDLGRGTARAEILLGKCPTSGQCAVSPSQCAIEVVYGSQVPAAAGASSAQEFCHTSSAFEQGELVDGLIF